MKLDSRSRTAAKTELLEPNKYVKILKLDSRSRTAAKTELLEISRMEFGNREFENMGSSKSKFFFGHPGWRGSIRLENVA